MCHHIIYKKKKVIKNYRKRKKLKVIYKKKVKN